MTPPKARGRVFFHRQRHGGPPLHLRLLALCGLCVLLLWGLFILLWRMGPSPEEKLEVERRVQYYVGYLSQDLGPQPSLAKAKAVGESSGWQFRWEGRDHSQWATDEELPPIDELQKNVKPSKSWGWYQGRYFSLRDLPQGRLALSFHPWKPPRVAGLRLALFLACAFCIIGFVTLAARRLLRPLRDLDAALASLAEGDLSARLPEPWRHDELGRLTRRFNQTAAEVGRMFESRRQLLLDVSHELRTPLTRLNLGLELLPDAGARASLKEDVAEMEAMVTEILEGARLEEAARWKPHSIDLSQLLEATAQELQGRKPGVAWSPGAAPIHVLGDARGLQILLRNLLDNALKYSGLQDQAVELSLGVEGANALLSVRDHGPGIAESALPHVFEPFYRADAARTRGAGGFGLGLHLVQRIAVAHGGEVKVENAPGGGALFSLRLPLVP